MGAHGEFAHTEKQAEIMKLILDEADTGSFITLDRLRATLSYGADVKKQAVLCSLRFLEKHGFIEKKYRGCKPMVIMPTEVAYKVFRNQPVRL